MNGEIELDIQGAQKDSQNLGALTYAEWRN